MSAPGPSDARSPSRQAAHLVGSDGISCATATLIGMDEPYPPEWVHAVTENLTIQEPADLVLDASPMSGILDKSRYCAQTGRLSRPVWSM